MGSNTSFLNGFLREVAGIKIYVIYKASVESSWLTEHIDILIDLYLYGTYKVTEPGIIKFMHWKKSVYSKFKLHRTNSALLADWLISYKKKMLQKRLVSLLQKLQFITAYSYLLYNSIWWPLIILLNYCQTV